jgi:hypothetical protein
MLYNVFLHELGHLQLVDEETRSIRLKFAREKLAQEFAMHWCSELWSKPFPHPDPVHNPPTPGELCPFPPVAVSTGGCEAGVQLSVAS